MKIKILLHLLFLTLLLIQPAYSDDAYVPPPVRIQVQKTSSGPISSSHEYIGRAEPVQQVKIMPEVSARITKVHFREGSFVKSGAVLFTLNSAPFSANTALKKAELAHANLERAQKYLSRLKAADRRSVPASDIDTAESEVKQTQAAVAEAKASLQLSQVDLNNTKITAPISGRIGRAEYTQGNYVSPGTVLAQIVQANPIRVSFSMPDRDYLQNRNLAGTFELILADGSTLPGGEVDFENNVMNTETGTIMIWLKFPNPENVIMPGALTRVRLISPEEIKVLVPITAVLTGNDGSFVYVIENDTAKVRKVTTSAEKENLIAVESGLKAGETIAVEGLSSLSDGSKVIIQK